MKSIPYILYAAVLSYVTYRVVKHALEHEPEPHVRSNMAVYDQVTGKYYDQLTNEEVDASEVMGVQ